MGDRVSISFRKGKEESVVLFHHWGGTEFPAMAKEYVEQLKADIEEYANPKMSTPLTRLEPRMIMVDFIRHLHNTGWLVHEDIGISNMPNRASDSIYFGKDQNDGDNSDNGHYIIEL